MDMFRFRRFLLIPTVFVFSFILENQVFANYPSYIRNNDQGTENHWFIGLGGGGARKDLPSTTTVPNGTPVEAPFNRDTFAINNPSDKGIIALFGGYQWCDINAFIPYYSLSLHYQHQFRAKITGTVEQYGLPQFTNYNYSTDLTSNIVTLVGKINLIQNQFLLPYISAGIGFAFNHVGDYAEQAIPPVFPRINPGYSDHTNINFVYSLGAGLDVTCNNNLWVTLGYEYLDLGKVHSGNGAGLWSSTHLSFGTLKSNTILASVTYFI